MKIYNYTYVLIPTSQKNFIFRYDYKYSSWGVEKSELLLRVPLYVDFIAFLTSLYEFGIK